MAVNFPIPYVDQLNAVYDSSGDEMESMMAQQLHGNDIDGQDFAKSVSKRLCSKDAIETIVKDACRVSSMAIKES